MQRALIGMDIAALVLTLLYLAGAVSYPMGTMDQPGPGMYPLFVGIFLLIATVCSLVSHLSRPVSLKLDLPKGRDLGRVLAVTAAAVAYPVLFPYAGHLLASVVTVFLVLHTMGLSSWLAKAGFTVAIGLGSYYLFGVILKVPLPRGVFGIG
jgi:putative tricarboxylic transport membrane protein